jgi:integrase
MDLPRNRGGMHIGQRTEVMTTGSIGEILRRVRKQIAEKDQRFEGIHFRPHDFRRLFATDLVNHGLPIHIGAALLGHLNLETTRGYSSVRRGRRPPLPSPP